jgi:hypothetical protein
MGAHSQAANFQQSVAKETRPVALISGSRDLRVGVVALAIDQWRGARMVTRTSFFTSLTLLLTVPAHATILVDQSDPYLQYFVGGSNLTDFTAALAATPGGYTMAA